MSRHSKPILPGEIDGARILSFLRKAEDAIERAEGRCPDCAVEPIAASYIDQQLEKAIRWLASARCLAVGMGIGSADTDKPADAPWHADDVVELGPIALGAKSKGGDS